MIKRWLPLFTALLLAGCGGGGGSASEPLPSEDPPAPASPSPVEREASSESPPEPESQPELEPEPIPTASGMVEIQFAYRKQSGMGSNQFAVWVEDGEGRHIRTVFVTAFSGRGGWMRRPETLPQWVEAADAEHLGREQVDTMTGATPVEGQVTCTWDCKDSEGNPVPVGTYRFLVEASLRGPLRALYSVEMPVGGDAEEITAEDGTFFPEETDETEDSSSSSEQTASSDGESEADEPAYEETGSEREMIGPVTVRYLPEEPPETSLEDGN